jgi:hypothetical protein
MVGTGARKLENNDNYLGFIWPNESFLYYENPGAYRARTH